MVLMVLNPSLKAKIVKIQEKEITEHIVYKRLSEKARGKNSEILKKSLKMNFDTTTNGKDTHKPRQNQTSSE